MVAPSLLKPIPLFRGFTSVEIARIARLARRTHFKAGAVIFEEGERGDALYIVERGELVIEKRPLTPGAPSLATLTFGARQFFGELSLIDAGPRAAAARTLEATDLIILKRSAFLRLVSTDARLAAKLFRSLMSILGPRVRQMNRELVALYEAGRLIGSSAAIDDLLPKLARILTAATGAERGVVFLINDLTRTLDPRASAGYRDGVDLPAVLLDSEHPVAKVFATGQTHRQAANRTHAGIAPSPYQDGATLLVPIVAAEQSVGVLLLGAPSSHPFRQDDANLVACLASQAAQAILRAKLIADAESQERLKQVRFHF